MKDALSENAAPGVLPPLRKCEWCQEPAQRTADLCLACEEEWTEKLTVPMDAGCEAECVFGVHRAVGVYW